MHIIYDIDSINNILRDFNNATGTRIDLYSNSFEQIGTGQYGICDFCKSVQKNPDCKRTCVDFDKKLIQKCIKSMQAERDICPFGLMNVVAPIVYNGEFLGYFFFGQIRTLKNYTGKEKIGDAEKKKYDTLNICDLEFIESISNLAEIILKHLLTENMLKLDYDRMLFKALEYIDSNLEKDLSIKNISQAIGVSKSALYSKFHTYLNCTVGEYVNKKRIEASLPLLRETDISIEEISQKTGFASASYYTKLFKKLMGTTPLKYKKSGK